MFPEWETEPKGLFVEWSTPDGQHYAFDGVFYSYTSLEGQGIKLWTPPGNTPLRGVFVFGNPGGGVGGDSRGISRQRAMLEFAARHNFGVAGVMGFPGKDTYLRLGKHILNAFREWGRHGVHPELEHVPFIFSGSSNAGAFSFDMLLLASERTIGITPNIGPDYNGKIDEAARKVPAWLHVGSLDPFCPGGCQDTEALFAEHAPQGALWTWEAEIKSHERGSSEHVDFAFWDAIIGLRIPAGAQDRTLPVRLNEIDPSTGWHTDLRTWDYPVARVFPASEPKLFPEDKGRYGWVPDEGIARLYQAAATHARHLQLSFVQKQKAITGASSGTPLSSDGGYLANPGESVTIRVTLAPMQMPLNVIEFYDRAEKIGEIKGSETLEFTFTVENRPLYAIYARSLYQNYSGKSFERISNPLQIIVRQPELSARIDAQLAAGDWLPGHKARAIDPAPFDRLKGDLHGIDDAGTLRAISLDAAQADGLRVDGTVSSLWQTVERTTAIKIDQKSELKQQAGDVQMHVGAAYGDAGLYLLFQIKDLSAGTNPDQKSGRIDFHIASTGLPYLRGARGSLDVYATPAANSLLRSALQMSFDVGGDLSATSISVNYWEPWDMSATQLIAADDFGGTGLKLNSVKASDDSQMISLFLPWTLVGNPGLREKPLGGTSLATLIGYNAINPSLQYRWPYAKDPWRTSVLKNPETAVFGEIVLMP